MTPSTTLRVPFRERRRIAVGALLSILMVVSAPVAASAETAPAAGSFVADSAATVTVAAGLRDGAAAVAPTLPVSASSPIHIRITKATVPVTPPKAKPVTTPPTTAPPVTAPPTTAPPVTAPPAPAPPAVPAGSIWDRLAACESGGNWAAATGNGFYGGLQFTVSSWHGVGGSGMPNQASRETQIAMGQRLQAAQGWGAWPACARRLGLR